MQFCKKMLNKYGHAIPLLLYAFIYISWFAYLEKHIRSDFYVIHMKIDDYIPFCEIFIIPYLLWFLYVAAVVVLLFFINKKDYAKCCIFLFTGMTLFLIISTLWPNGHLLRPQVMPRDNIFTQLITGLYQTDTSTNIWPSIHVYNSIGAHLAISKCDHFKKYKCLYWGSLTLCISIILSTVFIKQHSVFDVITAFALAGIMYMPVYNPEQSLIVRLSKTLHKNHSKTQTG